MPLREYCRDVLGTMSCETECEKKDREIVKGKIK